MIAMVGLLAVSEILIEAEEPFKEYKGDVGYSGMRASCRNFRCSRNSW